MQPDGKIVVVGWSINANVNWDLAVWRFNSSGSLEAVSQVVQDREKTGDMHERLVNPVAPIPSDERAASCDLYDWRTSGAGETRAYRFTSAGSVTARQRVVDSIGLSDSNTAAISTTLTDSLVVRIVQPREYGRIAGDVFSVHAVARGPGLSQQDIASVRFQFKAAASSAYTDIGTATGVPWKTDWAISSLPAGDYHLRAIAATASAQATSETVVVTIVADSRAAQYVEDRSGARPRLTAPVARLERSEIQDGRGGPEEEGGGFLSFLGGGGCLLVRAGWPGALLDAARGLRDLLLATSSGRIFVDLYYTVLG